MKDPIEEYDRQSQRLDEIFGWLSRTFGSKQPTAPRQSPIQHADTDNDCSPLGYKMSVGDKLNAKVAGSMGQANVTIGLNTIKNIKGLQFELVDNKGKGTGRFRHAVVRDFKCYDEGKDLYGIKWLFDGKVSYEAESISGQLKANKKDQGVDFKGKWSDGIFYGTFLSSPDDFNGTRGTGAVFVNKPQTTTTTKTTPAKKTKRKPAKKTTKKTSPKTSSTMTSPVTVSSVAPSSAVSGKTTPMTSRVAVGSIAPASAATSPAAAAGKKGRPAKKIQIPESKNAKPITMRGFLDSFM
jgi:hypothetical protein